MRRISLFAANAALLAGAKGLNVLLTSDDGFGSANIRELYKQMTALGHNCYIVAAPSAEVKVGVQTEFTTSPKLAVDGDWGLVKAGAPSIGPDLYDDHIWYYNGTAIAQVLVALDYIFPSVAKIPAPDLVISGPNSDQTVGGFPYTAAGALGPTYVAIQRDIPAMAFWSGNSPVIPYSWVNTTTKIGLQDPATITARLAATLIQAFIDKAVGSRVLPKGYGVAVNLPEITSYTSDECIEPLFYLAPESEDTAVKVAYNTKTGLVTEVQLGLEDADGDVGFVGEAASVNPACVSSVMVFAVNYNAAYTRECFSIPDVTTVIPVIVHTNGSTTIVGGRGPPPNTTGPANHSNPPTPSSTAGSPPPGTAISNMAVYADWSLAVLVAGLGIAVLSI